jgi:hypothetical protein
MASGNLLEASHHFDLPSNTSGDWVQSDEAIATLDARILNMALGKGSIWPSFAGLNWLNATFGVRPRVGYHIDAFGHSSISPYLSSLADMDALVVSLSGYLLS